MDAGSNMSQDVPFGFQSFIPGVPMHLSVATAILEEHGHIKVIQFKQENTDFQIHRDAGVKQASVNYELSRC
jgi:hypothetical protein